MFQKKQYLYSETLGACQVENIVQLSAKNSSSIQYYVLKSVLDRTKVAYIPVEHHQVRLREIFTLEEAEKMKDDLRLRKDEKLRDAVDFVLRNGGKIHGTADNS